MKVLNESHFEDIAIRGGALDDRDGGESEFFRSSPAAFAGDEFVFSVYDARDEWLDDAVLADGVDEVVERCIDELVAGLEWRRDDVFNRDFADARGVIG